MIEPESFDYGIKIQVPRNAISFSSARTFLGWPLGYQTHRERVYRALQFHERSQHFIRTQNEPLSVAAMSVNNPDRLVQLVR